VIYANNAGTSWPKPATVAEAVSAALTRPPQELGETYESAHAVACRFLGIEAPERLLLTSGCTSALALAVGDLPWREGDVVVTSAVEHHALARPIEKLVRERGVVHQTAPYRPGHPMDLDFVRDTLRGGRVRLVATTAASNVTGELLPVAELIELVHERDALYLLDAAQTVGVLPLDLRELNADILAFAGHKGPLGPHGVGGFWAAPSVSFESPWATCEIGSGAARAACSTFPGFCDVGSVNLAGVAGLAAGFQWLETNASDRPRRLARRLAAAIGQREGCTLLGGDARCERTATIGLTIPSLGMGHTEEFFSERGIVVRVGQHCAPTALEALGEPAGALRISFGHFNDERDVDAVIDVIDEAIKQG
jgi:selenocysteine lyase/cysteine desulfurase